MARKSSGASGVLIVAALILAALVELIKNYWPTLLIIGGIGVAVWLYRKSAAQSSAIEQDGAITLRVSVDSNFDSDASGYSFGSRQKPTVRDGDELWLPAGKSATVSGYLLNGGLLYVGKGLAANNGWQIEAALIDPSLPINQRDDDYKVRKLDYWPSYLEASREARASYLNWLAKGRSDPNADIGYVFMYFYGLERRTLVDAASSAAAKAELPAIMREVERLLAVYGSNYSFRNYANSLLDYLKAGQEHLDCQDSPPPLSPNGELAFAHRLCLGKMSTLRKPLPSEWAFIWMMGDPTTRLKTAAQRCPEEFKRAFIAQYTKEYGAGMLLPQNKTRLKLTHRPASPSFHGQSHLEKHFDLPDVTVLSSPMKKLQAIAESSMVQLDAYSRFLGRNPDKTESADALLELPFNLWPDKYRQPVEGIQATIKTAGKPLATKFERLQGLFPDWHESNRQKYQSLSRALSEVGMGIEPDVKFGGKVPGPDTMVVVFFDEDIQANREPTLEYGAASLTLHLAVSVSAADGEIGNEELQLLLRQIEYWFHLNGSVRRRLQAHLRLLKAEPPGTNNLKQRIEALSMSARQTIGEFLIEVAKADNEVTPAEVKLLEKIFKMLGLDTQSVYGLLHVSAPAPVTVRSSETNASGFAIPSPPKPKEAGIELDMDRIAALHAESEKVSAILGEIFVEETVRVEPEPTTPEEAEVEVHDRVMGLDDEHTALVRLLCTRPEWARDELEELAQDRGVLIDGALEHINEATFDTYNQPFCEGDDPIEINKDVVKEILQ